MRSDCVVPLATDAVVFDIELLHLSIGHLLPFHIDPIQQSGSYPQPRSGDRAANRVEHRVQTPQWLACPVQTDLAEQPMLNGIPFGAPSGIVADGYGESIAIAHLLLQVLLKAARPTAITPTRISEDQQLLRLGKPPSSLFFPPPRNGRYSKLWRIGRGANRDGASIAVHLRDAVGDGSQECIVWEVMHIDRLSFLTPGLPSIFARCQSTLSSWCPR
jgi:hypothetical protein